jgi:hypothetical protein
VPEPQTAYAVVLAPTIAAPPESALAVHELAWEPEAPTGEPPGLLGKLPIR